MRTFEIILLLAVTILPLVKRPLVRHVKPNYLLLFFGATLSLHLVTEGWRWQMFPAYLLILVIGWRIKVVDASNPVRPTFPRIIGFLGISVLVLMGWILSIVLPVFSLPQPSGTYQVGTRSIHIQTEKDEQITKAPSDKRELLCKVWYPSEADISSMEGEKYINDASRAGFATKYGLPPTALNYLDRVKTYVFPDIPIADNSFPVLIFSHGYGSKATGYYALLSEIASQGYIIINMNHTYESLGVTFPDGREKYFDYDFQRDISSESMEVVKPLIEAFKNGLSYEERHPIVRKAVKNYFEGSIQDRWAEDMIFTIDLLEKWNAEGWLKDKLDLDRIGVFGHSVGGGSVGNATMKDNRIKAAVNLDGIQWGNQIDSIYHVPYLYVSADWPAEHEDINSHVYINKSTDYFYETKLLNSGHPDFMDIPFMIPVSAIAGTGDIDPFLGTEIVTKLVTSFFDKHLKKLQNADPEKIGEQYELLEMTVYPGESSE
ncbi:MAG: hypothetical protein AAFZ15_21895 [Bacteroidota bacterium]